ncbi:MAG: NUDIX domain-containing protein [Gammaproteobacteria bacterium]|nr:NUDIX domain-containing protein [Gammaproteobacteria bacterium]
MKKIIRFFYKWATYLLCKIKSVLGVVTLGARAIILNQDNQILLVKHTYQPHWYLPGGGVKRGESIKTAVLRELREEVGIVTQQEPELFGIYFNTYLGQNDYPVIFVIKNYSIEEVDSPEIEAKGWFDFEKLPAMVSPGTQRRLSEYFSNSVRLDTW